ncbi:hypothetical protein J2Z31_004697 [Sinorhizobium kostiense]|uniref:Uncharacterized protein n=1 Tax=Sinorhizobium kostiense TaxID=76747 RepID=A0ABS4R765_9HYPH|nr:hypothetical protein [Sinorhizobium kostiense]
MLQHCRQEIFVGQCRILKPELRIGRSLLPDRFADGEAGVADRPREFVAARRSLEVLDNLWLDACVADQRRGPVAAPR